MALRFRYYPTHDGWNWKLLGANNRLLARAVEGLPNQNAAIRDALAVAVLACHGRIEVVGDGQSWRWVLTEAGRLRAVSGIGYARRDDCARAATMFRTFACTLAGGLTTPAPGTVPEPQSESADPASEAGPTEPATEVDRAQSPG